MFSLYVDYFQSNNEPQPDDLQTLEESDARLHPYCYVCHFPALQNGFYSLFVEPEEGVHSPAKILCDILELDVSPELCHSQIICVNCNMLCLEFQSLVQRMETIRVEMTMAYNQTVMKLAGLTEKDLKEHTVAAEDSEQLDSDLQTFNKELMSMEEVFRLEGLDADSVETDPSPEQIENGFPKLGIVWQSTTDSNNGHSNTLSQPSVLVNANQCYSKKAKTEEVHLIHGSEDRTVEHHSQESVDLLKKTITHVTNAETLERLISESNEGIVEVTGEDGSSIYCIYDDVIESYNLAEGQSQITTINAANTDCLLEYDEVVIDNSSQIAENASEEVEDENSPVVYEPITEEVSSAPPPPESPSMESNSLQPLFIKIEEMYYCTLCSTDGQVASYNVKTIAEHLRKEHDKNILVCEQCDAVFYRSATYNEHMDQHKQEEAMEFKCVVCNEKFSSLRALRVHGKTHSSSSTKPWVCKICDKEYMSKAFLDIHMNKHSGIRPHKCTVCSKDFTSKYVLTVHMKTHKERTRTFTCNECGSSFYNRNNLVQHERTHKGVRDYECSDCGKTFLSQHNLNVHKIIHTDLRPFVCRTCGKAFARKSDILDHERTHTGEKPFSCDMCDASFAQRSNLYSHRRLTHLNDKRFKCEDCGACFKRRRLLLYHTRAAHTGERPYKCELCPATFVYPEHFHKHKRIHTGMKPYACEVCHKTFNSPDNRNAHRYVHSDKKPFECVTCGSGFMRKSHLYAHMQKRGHLRDTIVVNQPRITGNDTLEFESEPMATDDQQFVDGEDYEEEPKMHVIYEEDKNTDDIIDETEEYYISNENPEEEAEILVDSAASSSSTANMGLISKIPDSEWTNFIAQED
ncbi:zinc finger and SCAN domain-containing protein 12-like [Anopheles nili]|uniref:zinc finger and SCAN domain-containing protein 12-like n=1 Tax=Anopheles nili TaxID=185578 RepID=UPI00237B2686|nr:zinc finger and SCAN domain-containing protein 12-like [Anopheles nili]